MVHNINGYALTTSVVYTRLNVELRCTVATAVREGCARSREVGDGSQRVQSRCFEAAGAPFLWMEAAYRGTPAEESCKIAPVAYNAVDAAESAWGRAGWGDGRLSCCSAGLSPETQALTSSSWWW